jgi:hypothetical protein
MEPTLRQLIARRPFALSLLLAATLVAFGAKHLLGLTLPRLFDPPILIAAIGLTAWTALALMRRRGELELLAAEARELALSVPVFSSRARAWLVGEGDDEPESEALREAICRRHRALTAAIECHLRHEAPETSPEVQAHTTPLERGDRRGRALIDAIVALQRESLAEARRRGFIGEREALLLEDTAMRLEQTLPVPVEPAPTDRLLSFLVGVFAAILPMSCSQRVTTAAMGAFAGLVLILFEALATAPVRHREDPRRGTLKR